MYRRHRFLALFPVLLAVSATSPLHADPPADPSEREPSPAVHVTTGLVSLPERHTYRLMVVKVGKDPVPVSVQAQVLDQRGKVVARAADTLRGGRAAVLDLARLDIPGPGPLQLRARLLLTPLEQSGVDPFGSSCPLNLTVQTLEDDLADGPFETCGVDPCCDDCGPGGFPGVQFNCGSTEPILVAP